MARTNTIILLLAQILYIPEQIKQNIFQETTETFDFCSKRMSERKVEEGEERKNEKTLFIVPTSFGQ